MIIFRYLMDDSIKLIYILNLISLSPKKNNSFNVYFIILSEQMFRYADIIRKFENEVINSDAYVYVLEKRIC